MSYKQLDVTETVTHTRTFITCDQCGEHTKIVSDWPASTDVIPIPWIGISIVGLNDKHGSYHFCMLACLQEWLVS